MAITFTNIVVGEGVLSIGATEGTATDVGATQEGVAISWEPDMVDIEVDQFGDAARVVKSKIKVMVKTKLAEATLENLSIAWNYDPDDIVTTSVKTMNIPLADVYPFERFLMVVGNAPGTTASTTYNRTYRCNRAVQYSASEHSLQRADNSAFPVEFRILPDPTQTGAEYGSIEDQI